MNQIQIALDNGLNLRQALVLIKLAEIKRDGGLNPIMKQITHWIDMRDASSVMIELESKELVFREKQEFDLVRFHPTKKGLEIGRKLTHFP